MSENATHPAKSQVMKNYTWYSLGFFIGMFTLLGAWGAFNSRGAVAGSWLESHVQYQLRTLAVTAGGILGGMILAPLHFGMVFLTVFIVWYVRRVAIGMMALARNEEISPSWV